MKASFATKEYIINTVFKTNVLPIISECNTSCIFCSHKQNPAGIEVFRMPKMELEDFSEIINFLTPRKKIVIGESATRIMEGEPLLYKDFIGVLKLVRQKYKDTVIQVTTNGILLDGDIVDKMVGLERIELNVSINCINAEKRKRLLGLKDPGGVKDRIRLLEGRLKFSGSCVFVPEILDENDIVEMAAFLDASGADNMRLFLPGYTEKTDKGASLESIYLRLQNLLEKIKAKYAMPIIIEPSFMSDLACRIEGVIKGSEADKAGIKEGDIISAVNGEGVSTRVELFNRVYQQINPVLTVYRQNGLQEIQIRKSKNCSPGFIVLHDIDPGIVEDIKAVVSRYRSENVLFLTSEMAFNIFLKLFGVHTLPFRYDIINARNRFFGGTIKCAGLLTVEDIIGEIKDYLEYNEKPDLILLPPVMFDFKMRDLSGRSMKEIEKEFDIPVDTL